MNKKYFNIKTIPLANPSWSPHESTNVFCYVHVTRADEQLGDIMSLKPITSPDGTALITPLTIQPFLS